jgi:hypothetical protein
MPRLSLYRPEKGNDYKFIDRRISEMFTIGATDVFLHKYLGTKPPSPENATADQPIYDAISETNIQDLLLMENRDRKYDSDIYIIRGHYNVQDLDFNLSQFGMFFENDTMYMTIHINDFIEAIGRKPMNGDALELPHLRDQFALNNSDYSLPRFFVISDVGRAAEGFSPTWYPHLYRLKITKISNEAQYSDIFNVPLDPDANFLGDWDPTLTYNPGDIVRYQGKLYTVTATTTGNLPTDPLYFQTYGGETLVDLLSVSDKTLQANDAVIAQAEADTAKSGFETRQFFTLSTTNGDSRLQTADMTDIEADYTGWDASEILERPLRSGYCGYLLGDGVPENGAPFGHGVNFPDYPTINDFYLRTDFLPNRLFRYNGARWIKHEDSIRHTLTNTDTRQTLKTSFINNDNITTLAHSTVTERQSLSKSLRPKADF